MAYDLLLANINKNTIMSNWDSLLGVTHKKTSIVLSGFYKEDLSRLIINLNIPKQEKIIP